MKILLPSKKLLAITLIEVQIVMLISAALLVFVVLPKMARSRGRSSRPHCIDSLKQIGVAFKVWEGDHQDKYPMQVSVTNGGTMELVASGTVFQHFQVMSNELNSPKILFCPEEKDPARIKATTFAPVATIPGTVAFTGNSNISYFIGVDASDANPAMPLAGDRNLTYTGIPISPGLHTIRANRCLAWAATTHTNSGNILLADGSVWSSTAPQLSSVFQNSGVSSNRLAFP